MKDERKTKGQLIKELADLRNKIDGPRKRELRLKRAVEALPGSEIRFKELVDSLPQAFFELNEEAKLLFANRNAFSMFGFSAEDLGKDLNAFQTIAPEDRDRAKGNIQRALSGERVGPCEYKLLRKDGSAFPAIVYCGPVSKENRPVGLRGIVIDITDRKRTEEALREGEKRYRVLADNAVDLIFTLDMSLGFTYVSPSVRQLLGYTPEEAMDLGLREVLAPDSAKLAFEAFAEQMAREASGVVDPSRQRIMELKLVAKDRSTVWTEVKMSFLREPDGHPTGVLGVVRDIKERKRTQQALRQSEERLRALFDHAATGMALVDTNGRVLATNQANCRFLGYSQEEIVGMHFADFTHPEDLNADEALYESLLKGQRDSYVIDKRYVRKDGETVWGRLSVSLIRDQEGQAQYSVVVCEDITDRKRAEEATRESEARYRAVMEQSPDGIYLVDVETSQVMEANSAFQKILGYTYSETLGLSFPDFVVGNREDLDQRFMDVLSGKGPFTFERKYRRKDGSLLDVWVSTRVISFGGRKAILVLVRDLTELTRARNALQESEARYRAVMEQSPDAIYLTDIDARRLLEANAAFQNLLGYSPGEIEGLSLYDIVAAERADIDERIQTILRDDGATFYERQFRRKDGCLVDVLTSSKVISYGERKATCVLVHDLSERKRAGEALRQSEVRYRAVMEQSPDAIYLVDVETRRLLETNSAFQRMTGYSSEEAKGLSNYDLIAVEPEEIDRRFQEVLQAKGPLSYERQFRRKDGSVIDVWISANVISYGGRDVACALVRDLTERKRAEQVLKESEELYRAVVEQSVDAIYLVEVGTKRVLEANTSFRNMLGYSAEEILQLTSYDIVAADRNEVDRVFNEILRNEGPVFYERRLRKKDGSSLDVWLSVSVISHGGRKVMAVIARDLTDRKRVEAEINQRNRELTSLLGVSLRLASRLDSGELLNAIVASVISTLPAAEAASLWLYDEEHNELAARAWAGHNDDFFSGLAVSPDASLVGLVYLSRQPQMIDDTAKEQTLRYPGWPLLDGAASVLGVPLMIGEQPIGTLLASNYSRLRSFAENDSLLLQSLAAQAAIAIQNAQLFEQVGLGRKRLQALSQRLVEVQEAERRRIARELHDEIGQALTAVKINLQGAQRLLETPGLSHELQETVNTVERTLQQVRGLSLDLRPPMLDDLGLIPALRWHVDRQGQQGGFCPRFTADPLEDRLRPDLEIACFRVAQEALTNVIRHAHARQVSVELRTIQEELELIIRDDGVGFDVKAALEKASQGLSLGLLGMEERVRLAGGQANFESIPGHGTQIRVRFPLIWLRHPGAGSERR